MDLDDSLTNINWLGRFSCRGIVPTRKKKAASKLKPVKPPSGVPIKRPQHSYSELIKLALNSTPSRRLALKQIYIWVEEHFPYYKYHAKPEWKNSIRHNLSAQDIFVREAGESGRTSFWSMRVHSQSNVLLTAEKNKDVTPSDTVNKKGAGKRKMPPLLPRGVLHCLVPLPVIINASPAPAITPLRPAPQNSTQRVIAPKLPIALCPQAGRTFSEPPGPSHSSRQAVGAQCWGREPQGSRQRRKQKHQLLKVPEAPLHPLLEKQECPLQALLSTSTDSGIGSENTVSPGQKTGSPSSFKTPVKRTHSDGLVTSTPCTDPAPTLPSPNRVGHTPRSALASFLDSSFFQSPGVGIVADEDLGLSSLRDSSPYGTAPMTHSLSEFSTLGFTPIRDIAPKGQGSEGHDESLPPVFTHFSLGGLDQGPELTGMS
ncbi:hypothetical protein JZ751_016969, partial [Albula glossodonta]